MMAAGGTLVENKDYLLEEGDWIVRGHSADKIESVTEARTTSQSAVSSTKLKGVAGWNAASSTNVHPVSQAATQRLDAPKRKRGNNWEDLTQNLEAKRPRYMRFIFGKHDIG